MVWAPAASRRARQHGAVPLTEFQPQWTGREKAAEGQVLSSLTTACQRAWGISLSLPDPQNHTLLLVFFATQSALLDFFAHRHLFYIFPGCSLGRNETASTSRGLLAHNQATTTRMIDSSEEWYKAGLIKHAVLSAWHSSQHEGKINGYFLLIGSDRNCISDKLNPSILVKCQNIPICKLHLLAAAKRKQLRDQRQKFLFAVGGLRKHVQNSSKQYA